MSNMVLFSVLKDVQSECPHSGHLSTVTWMISYGSPCMRVAPLWPFGAPLFPEGFVILGLIICLDGGV